MTRDGMTALEAELRGSAPEGLQALSDEQLDDLATGIHEARRRQAQALSLAGDRALNQIPRVLRGPVKRLFR